MTTDLTAKCPECDAEISVTINWNGGKICGTCGVLYAGKTCPCCVLHRTRHPRSVLARGPVIPGWGRLETKDASFDYGKENGG